MDNDQLQPNQPSTNNERSIQPAQDLQPANSPTIQNSYLPQPPQSVQQPSSTPDSYKSKTSDLALAFSVCAVIASVVLAIVGSLSITSFIYDVGSNSTYLVILIIAFVLAILGLIFGIKQSKKQLNLSGIISLILSIFVLFSNIPYIVSYVSFRTQSNIYDSSINIESDSNKIYDTEYSD